MSKLKSRLVKSVSACALALFAVSFALAPSQARAEDHDAGPAQPQTIAVNVEPATARDVACDHLGDDVLKCASDTREMSTDDMERIMAGMSPIELATTDDGSPPPEVHSAPAILLEITQSVTIAVAGQPVDQNEDVTGSIAKPTAAGAEPVMVEASLPNDD